MAKSPSPAFQNSPFLQFLKLKFTKSSANLGQISSLQETQNPPRNVAVYLENDFLEPQFSDVLSRFL